MAKEIMFCDPQGGTCYVLLFNTVGQVWDTTGTPAFETYDGAQLSNYDLAGTQLGTSKVYTADMPSVSAGLYYLVARRQAGGSPAQSDENIAMGLLQWDGSAVEALYNAQVNVGQFGGTNGTFSAGRPEVNSSHAAGTAWNSGAIGASTLASDTITAGKIAADAIGASELAASAVDEILDEVIEGTLTLRQAIRILVAAVAGKSSGHASNAPIYRDTTDSTDRITATVNTNGDRTSVTLNAS